MSLFWTVNFESKENQWRNYLRLSLKFKECFEQPLAEHFSSCALCDVDFHKTFPQILQKYVFLSSKGT
jgi:hypothetical protein